MRRTHQHTTKACAILAAGLALLCGRPDEARAAGPLGPQGSRIGTSGYGVDLFQGPILAGSRIMGLGGAYTAIAEGTEGIPFNPAAASLRSPYSTTRADYDLTAGLTLPSSVKGTDFDNNGKVGFAYDNFVWVTAGGLLQYDKLGFGAIVSFQNYALGAVGPPVPLPTSDPNSTEQIQTVIARIVRIDPVVSYAFANEQLHLGGGLRIAGVYLVGKSGPPGQEADTERLLLNSNSAGLQAGALWTPRDLPLRVGGVARSPVIPVTGEEGRFGSSADGDRVFNNIYLPQKLELPFEIEAGAAVQLWKRPLNLPWYDEDKVPAADSERWRRTINGQSEPAYRGARRMLKARYRALPREKVLLSVSALLSGPIKNSVGIESMLSQTVDRSGERAVVTIRAGAEAEVIPQWLVVRLGSYLEPTRYQGRPPADVVTPGAPIAAPDPNADPRSSRLHGTAGFSLRTIRWDVFGLLDEDTIFRVSSAVDIARDYFGWGLGAGLWL